MNPPGRPCHWITVGLGLVGALLVAASLANHEPCFEGRKLSAWLDDPTLTAAQIERAVRAIGTNAIPQLQDWLVQQPSLLERAVRQLDHGIDFIGISFHPSLEANFRAMRGFLVLGELAAPAVPWLKEGAAKHDANFEFYLKALTVCGPAGWQAVDWLEVDNSKGVSSAYLNALAFGAHRSTESKMRLSRCLEHPDLKTRHEVYQTIRLLREGCPKDLLAALEVRAIKEPDDKLRELARLFATQLAKERADAAPAPPGTSEPAGRPE